MKIIDLSLTIDNKCLTCGTKWHQKVKITPLGRIDEVGRNTHSILLGSHSATHIDAPLHFFEEGIGVDTLKLEELCGEISVVDFSWKKKWDTVCIDDVSSLDIHQRMIFRFDWFKKWKQSDYYEGFPFFDLDAAQYLVDKGMRFMALDTPSPDNGAAINNKDDSPVHKLLLGKKVIIAEYLTNTNLLDVSKRYNIIALPLKIQGCDGCPARIIAIEKES